MTAAVPRKSSRKFTKIFVVSNILLVWALMFTSIVFQQAEHVINGGLALIGTFFGIYTGVGHLDFRKAIELTIERASHQPEQTSESETQ